MIDFRSALSTRPDPSAALAEVLAKTGQSQPDLVLLFTSGAHNAELGRFSDVLQSVFRCAVVIGSVGSGVIGGGREIEGETAVAVLVAQLPGVRLSPFFVHPEDSPRTVEQWQAVDAEQGMLVLADPFSIDIANHLPSLHRAFPDVPIFGGLGSAAPEHPGARLVVDGVLQPAGAVGLGFSGPVSITTCVAQGCRPVGAPMFVTHCEGNRIVELDGRNTVEVLREIYESLDTVDQVLFGRALFIGVQMRDQTEYVRGDFLIRNVVGIAVEPPSLVVGYSPERFQVVQLHVRDEAAAREDLAQVLHGTEADPCGALLVSCVGRGRGLFGEPDHDSRMFASRFGGVSLGGFFANGEIGPVQGRPYVHGYTSVFALFQPPADPEPARPNGGQSA